jgi:curli biogenesis system outer membrane secretion channel CsgG
MKKLLVSALVLMLSAAGCTTIGSSSASTPVTGAAAGSSSVNQNQVLEHCDQPLGTVTIHEDTGADWYYQLSSYNLGSTIPLIRLMIQQSNCFVVVERGRGFNDMMRERQLQQSGELREGSNFRKGQLVAADYTIEPSIVFSEKDTGGIGGVIGGKLGKLGALLGAGLKFKDASVTLLLIDNRSGVQLAAAQGSARGFDLGNLNVALGGGFLGLGGYAKTPEGKVIAAAFIDAYNNMVRALKQYKAQKVEGGLGKGGKLNVSE